MNFGEVNRKLVLFHVGFVRLLEAAVGSLGLAQRFVQVEVMRTGVDDAAGDVGAVVGCALKVGQKIGEDKASLNAAMALLHAQDVARAHLLLERTSDHCSNIAGCVIDAAQHNLNLHETLRAAHSDTHAFRSEFQRYAAKYALPAPASAQ